MMGGVAGPEAPARRLWMEPFQIRIWKVLERRQRREIR